MPRFQHRIKRRPAATTAPLIRATVPPGEDCIHEIRSGETLFMLSWRTAPTVDAIAAASDIENPDRIAIGQRITIPGLRHIGFRASANLAATANRRSRCHRTDRRARTRTGSK